MAASIPAGARGKHLCKIWQRVFPDSDPGEDGKNAAFPVDAFPLYAYGIYTITGNAWEWCMPDSVTTRITFNCAATLAHKPPSRSSQRELYCPNVPPILQHPRGQDSKGGRPCLMNSTPPELP